MSDKPGVTTLDQLAEVAQGAGRDEADLLDHVQRAAREPRHGQGRRAGAKPGAIGQVIQTIGLGPHRINPATRPEWFWDKATVRRHPVRHRIPPGRSVPLFHRLDARRRGHVAGRQRPPPRSSRVRGLRRRRVARQPRHRLHPRRLVHAGRPLDLGRWPVDHPRHRRASSRSGRTSTSAAGPARATCSWSTRRRRVTSTARTWRSPTANDWSTTSSTGPRRRCRRRTASSPPS